MEAAGREWRGLVVRIHLVVFKEEGRGARRAPRVRMEQFLAAVAADAARPEARAQVEGRPYMAAEEEPVEERREYPRPLLYLADLEGPAAQLGSNQEEEAVDRRCPPVWDSQVATASSSSRRFNSLLKLDGRV